jgi:hypothetical protein
MFFRTIYVAKALRKFTKTLRAGLELNKPSKARLILALQDKRIRIKEAQLFLA